MCRTTAAWPRAHARIAAGGVRRPARASPTSTPPTSRCSPAAVREAGRGGARAARRGRGRSRPRTGSPTSSGCASCSRDSIGGRRRRGRPGAGDQLRVRGRGAQPRARPRRADRRPRRGVPVGHLQLARARRAHRRGDRDGRPASGDESWTEAILAELDEPAAVVSVPNVHWTNGALIDLGGGRRAGARARGAPGDRREPVGRRDGARRRARCGPTSWSRVGYKWLLGPFALGYLWVAPEHRDGAPIEQNWILREAPGTSRAWSTTATPTSPARGGSTWASGRAFSSCRWRSRRSSSCWSGRSRGSRRRSPRPRARSPPGPLSSASSPRRPTAAGRTCSGSSSRRAARPGRCRRSSEAGCFAALRGDSLRLSPHLHNTPAEVERLLGALGADRRRLSR